MSRFPRIISLWVMFAILSSLTPSAISKDRDGSQIEKWDLEITSKLSGFDSLSTNEFSFEVRIREKKFVDILRNPEFEISSGTLLTSTKKRHESQMPLAPDEEMRSAPPDRARGDVSYFCYSPKPRSVGGNTGGSSVQPYSPLFIGEEFHLPFRCWFPLGMLPGEYILAIYLRINKNSSGGRWPDPYDWENHQIFIFGDTEGDLSPFSDLGIIKDESNPQNMTVVKNPKYLVTRMPSHPKIKVAKSFQEGSIKSIDFDSQTLGTDINKLKRELDSRLQRRILLTEDIEQIQLRISELQTLSRRLWKRDKRKIFRTELSRLFKEMTNLSESTYNLERSLKTEPLPLPNEIKPVKYLSRIDFLASSRPVITRVELPIFEQLDSSPTPFIRIRVESATLPTYINAGWFRGNVLWPGERPFHDGMGTGLALVESLSWREDKFHSSILLSPIYTPLDLAQLNDIRKLDRLCINVLDAAENSSTVWNLVSEPLPAPLKQINSSSQEAQSLTWYRCGPPPRHLQTIKASNDFDELSNAYLQLFELNARLLEPQGELLKRERDLSLAKNQISLIAFRLSTIMKILRRA